MITRYIVFATFFLVQVYAGDLECMDYYDTGRRAMWNSCDNPMPESDETITTTYEYSYNQDGEVHRGEYTFLGHVCSLICKTNTHDQIHYCWG